MTIVPVPPGGPLLNRIRRWFRGDPSGASAIRSAHDKIIAIADAIDKQTYEERRRGHWDLPDDRELSVIITAGDERRLNEGLAEIERWLLQHERAES